ncbi:hypothetical protein [Lonomia obliqua multiple nucleopolyhedrovirus]|uniref:Uncharacterized protein n=1 Tax=Lonomia obliqua multiple nucleopolyhedrovirus TaxID=134394 RepID=A0A126FC69_9ABAC|nr:hypothetical protein [Lonomia obliqua multiple nucleopolyhedrovirus]AKN80984.1 hypothetical protein [Lonomia obliqua multiple nucleopolyhedrovirus]
MSDEATFQIVNVQRELLDYITKLNIYLTSNNNENDDNFYLLNNMFFELQNKIVALDVSGGGGDLEKYKNNMLLGIKNCYILLQIKSFTH